MSKAWTIDSPNAVAEVIDGELVVMNLATGNYFSGQGVGAALWAGFERCLSREALLNVMTEGYEVDRPRASTDLDAFVRALIGHGLIRPCEAREASAAVPAQRQPYAAPELKLYTDMKDLLMLDPIHDVAEEGWPMRPAEASRG